MEYVLENRSRVAVPALLSSLLFVAGAAVAQDALDPAAVVPSGESWRVPPQAETDDQGRETGALWAGGESYKVRFGEPGEVRFVPLLGAAFERNLPLGWRTVSVGMGEQELLRGDVHRVHDERRVSWSWQGGRLVEHHDLRDAGVEQSFVLRDRPAAVGDLRIRLKLDSELVAVDRTPRHAPIDFLEACGYIGRGCWAHHDLPQNFVNGTSSPPGVSGWRR